MWTIEKIINTYRNKGIIVDSNLLLLYAIGKCDIEIIEKFKRTSIFTKDDFYSFVQFIYPFKQIITTPNILTEVSNLANQLQSNLKERFCLTLESEISLFTECYIDSAAASRLEKFKHLGLTDSAIYNSAKNKYPVITIDFDLYSWLINNKIGAVNFNHIRPL